MIMLLATTTMTSLYNNFKPIGIVKFQLSNDLNEINIPAVAFKVVLAVDEVGRDSDADDHVLTKT